jgi:hypothetical protein
VSRIGASRELHDDIFTLTKAAPVGAHPYRVGDSYYVVSLKDRETPDMSKFAEDKEVLEEQALSAKRNRVLKDWLTHLQHQANVAVNPLFLQAPMETGGDAPVDNG